MIEILTIFVEDVHDVLTTLCSYEDEIMIGSAVVGIPEAIPIEKTICTLNDGTEIASHFIQTAMIVVKSYRDVIECSELRYQINIFVMYSEAIDEPTYNEFSVKSTYESGDLAGNIYRYNKACQDKSKDIKKAMELLKKDIKDVIGIVTK